MSDECSARACRCQGGIVLIEALVSMLIFSVGVLAIIGLLTASVLSSRDSANRAAAGLLANQIIGQMWVDDHSSLLTNYDTASGVNCTVSGTNCYNWMSNVSAMLPGVAGVTANFPTITVASAPNPQTIPPSTQVTVKINWQPPDAKSPHQYIATTMIN